MDDIRNPTAQVCFYSFAAGLCAGCGAMFKPTSLAAAAAFGVVAAVQCRCRPTRLCLMALAGVAGVAVPAGMTLAYLLASDTLSAMPNIWRELGRYAANSPRVACDMNKVFTVPMLVGIPVLVRGFIGRRRRPIASPHDAPDAAFAGPAGAGLGFAVAWLAFDLLGAISQGRLCAYHFLPIAAPTAMLVGMFPRRDTAALLAAALWPALALSATGAVREIAHAVAVSQPARLAVSDYLAAHAAPGDAVWADNAARLWLETGMEPGGRVPLTYLFLNTDDAPFRYGRMIVDDLESRRTRWVVLPARLHDGLAMPHDYTGDPIAQRRRNMLIAWGWIDGYVRGHYDVASIIGDQTIYVRR